MMSYTSEPKREQNSKKKGVVRSQERSRLRPIKFGKLEVFGDSGEKLGDNVRF